MQRTIPLGRIAGIQIGANWSWLIIFALVAWSLAEAVFPDQTPGLTDTTYPTAAFGALWLVLIGWFLSGAAHAEAQDVAVRRALGGLRVSDVMSPEPVSVPPDVTLQAFADEYAVDTTFTSYPVVEQDRVVGLLPFEAVTSVPRDEWDTRTVSDVMLPRDRVALLDADRDAADAVQELAGADVDRALVVKDDHLVGLVAPADLARAVQLAGTDPQAG